MNDDDIVNHLHICIFLSKLLYSLYSLIEFKVSRIGMEFVNFY